MTLKKLEHVGVVVNDLDAAKESGRTSRCCARRTVTAVWN